MPSLDQHHLRVQCENAKFMIEGRYRIENCLIFGFRRTSSDTSQIAPRRAVQRCSAKNCQNQAAFMCQGCNKAVYCGRKCQETAWNEGHDEICGETDDENKWLISKLPWPNQNDNQNVTLKQNFHILSHFYGVFSAKTLLSKTATFIFTSQEIPPAHDLLSTFPYVLLFPVVGNFSLHLIWLSN